MRWLGVVALIALGLIVWGTWGLLAGPAVSQPIQFPHKTHVQQLKLNCTSCHQRAEKGTVAGRPPTALCFACHAAGETKSEELKKLRAFGEKGQEIPWKRVWRLPPHVFFSHRTHVAVAKLKCQTCHGPMETLDRPPARPLKRLRMGDCIGCHEKTWKGPKQARAKEVQATGIEATRVTTDCNLCHR